MLSKITSNILFILSKDVSFYSTHAIISTQLIIIGKNIQNGICFSLTGIL